MKWLKVFGIGILVLVLVVVIAVAVFIESLPTSVKHLPYIELRNSVLVTPRGPIPLILRGEKFFNRGGHPNVAIDLSYSNLDDELRPVKFRLALSILGSPHGTIQLYDISPDTDSKHVSFPDEAFYQKNDGQRIRISVRQDSYIQFDMPGPLSQYDFAVYDGTMSDASASQAKVGETDIHFFSIPLVVGSERHEIQLKFRLGVESKEVITSVLFGGLSP